VSLCFLLTYTSAATGWPGTTSTYCCTGGTRYRLKVIYSFTEGANMVGGWLGWLAALPTGMPQRVCCSIAAVPSPVLRHGGATCCVCLAYRTPGALPAFLQGFRILSYDGSVILSSDDTTSRVLMVYWTC
jgi:hypothetical protein